MVSKYITFINEYNKIKMNGGDEDSAESKLPVASLTRGENPWVRFPKN